MSVAAPQSHYQPHPYADQRPQPRVLRDDSVSQSDRNWAVAIHLAPFAAAIFGPLVLASLVIWLIRKDESVFCDDHGRELINFGLSQLILHIILAVTLIGVILWPVLWIVALISLIRGAVAAGNGEYFRYPMTFRMV